MKTLFIIFLFLFPLAAYSQQLYVDSTRYLTGNKPYTQINYAIPTSDKGILFIGQESGNPGGIIPYFPLDTGVNGNVLIGNIDSNQQISWIKVYGGSGEDNGFSACQTPDGGYAVVAATTSNNGDITGFKGTQDIWLMRIDGSGNLLWERCYGSSQDDLPISIANTADSGFIILGATNGSDGDVPFHYGSTWKEDWLVIKTDNAGNVQWSKDIGGTGEEHYSGSILAIDTTYYLISNSESTDFDCKDTAWHEGVYTGDDYYVVKLGSTGNILWDSSYGGSNTDETICAMLDARDSTIVIVGTTASNDYMITGYNGGASDIWVLKINRNGTLVWQKVLGSPNADKGTGICVAHNGGYIAYGWTGSGGGDCWLFTLDNTGNVTAEKKFGSAGYDESYSIVPYLNGYAATGRSDGNSFTEGTTGVRNYVGMIPFISYIDSGTLSIVDVNESKSQFKAYPNPAHDMIKMVVANAENGYIRVFNSVGQVVYSDELHSTTSSIEIRTSGWVSGIYCIQWKSENGNVQTTRFVKM